MDKWDNWLEGEHSFFDATESENEWTIDTQPHDDAPASFRQLPSVFATYGKRKVVEESTLICKNRMGEAAAPRYSSGAPGNGARMPGLT